MTPPKRWPTNAEWARMDALTNLRKIRQILRDVAEDPRMERAEIYRRLSLIGDEVAAGLETLLLVGPRGGVG